MTPDNFEPHDFDLLAEHEKRAKQFAIEIRKLMHQPQLVQSGCRGRAYTKLEDALDPLFVLSMMPELREVAEKIGIEELKKMAALEYRQLAAKGIDIASVTAEGPLDAYPLLNELRTQVGIIAVKFGGIETFPPTLDLDKSGGSVPSVIMPILKISLDNTGIYRYMAAYKFTGIPINPTISSRI